MGREPKRINKGEGYDLESRHDAESRFEVLKTPNETLSLRYHKDCVIPDVTYRDTSTHEEKEKKKFAKRAPNIYICETAFAR
jgi:hypothetical protein